MIKRCLSFLHRLQLIFGLSIILLLLFSCNGDSYVPKPHGYFRIDLPQPAYQVFDSAFPYRFEFPEYAKIVFDKYTRDEPYWLNIEYPQFKGKIHLSYKDVLTNDLNSLVEDTRTMVYKHASMAIGIKESIVIDPQNDVFGTVYTIEGRDAASPFQFFVTDSTRHFLRGSLYFYTRPNNDSLQPVIDFVINDIDHLIGTLEWKEIK